MNKSYISFAHYPVPTTKTKPTPNTSNQATLPAVLNKITPYFHESRHFQKCEHSLLCLVCKAMLPVSIIDYHEFRSFAHTLDPRYNAWQLKKFLKIPTVYVRNNNDYWTYLTHKLVQQCNTRWGSVYSMLERFLEHRLLCVHLGWGRNWLYLPEGRDCKRKWWNHLFKQLPWWVVQVIPAVGIVSPFLYTAKNVKHVIYTYLSHDQEVKHVCILGSHFKDLDPFIPEDERCYVVEAVKLEIHFWIAIPPEITHQALQ